MVLSVYNFKGGVGKTTLTYHLAKTMARRGHRVLVVDLDPQCNLTEMCLGKTESKQPMDIAMLWDLMFRGGKASFRFTDAVDVTVQPAGADPALKVKLLPGSLKTMFMDLDTQLALARQSSLAQFENVQGGLLSLIHLVGICCQMEVIVLDLNPSASLVNRNLLLASSGILLPCLPDDFSLVALESLGQVFPSG